MRTNQRLVVSEVAGRDLDLNRCSNTRMKIEWMFELFEQTNGDETFMQNVITGGESWVDGYDIEAETQSL